MAIGDRGAFSAASLPAAVDGLGVGVVCLRRTGAQNGALSNTTPWTRLAVPVSPDGRARKQSLLAASG